MAERSTDSMSEFERKMLHLISDAKAAPDINDSRDLPFLIDLETRILQFIREPIQEAGGITAAGPPPGPEMMGGEMMGGPPGAMGGGPITSPIGGRSGAMAPPDELSRLLR